MEPLNIGSLCEFLKTTEGMDDYALYVEHGGQSIPISGFSIFQGSLVFNSGTSTVITTQE